MAQYFIKTFLQLKMSISKILRSTELLVVSQEL